MRNPQGATKMWGPSVFYRLPSKGITKAEFMPIGRDGHREFLGLVDSATSHPANVTGGPLAANFFGAQLSSGRS
jgi:hypothetical protein